MAKNYKTLEHIDGQVVKHSTITSQFPDAFVKRKRNTGELIITTDTDARYGMHHIYLGGEHIAGGYGFATTKMRDDLCYIAETYNAVFKYFDDAYTYQTDFNKKLYAYITEAYTYLSKSILDNSFLNLEVDENYNKITVGEITYSLLYDVDYEDIRGTLKIIPDSDVNIGFNDSTYLLSKEWCNKGDFYNIAVPIRYNEGFIQGNEILFNDENKITNVLVYDSVNSQAMLSADGAYINAAIIGYDDTRLQLQYVINNNLQFSSFIKVKWVDGGIIYGNHNDLSADSVFFDNARKNFRNEKLLKELYSGDGNSIHFTTTIIKDNYLYIILPASFVLPKIYVTSRDNKDAIVEGGFKLFLSTTNYNVYISDIQKINMEIRVDIMR